MAKNKKQFIFLVLSTFLFFGALFPGCSSKPVLPKDAGVFKSIDGGLTWERKIQVVAPVDGSVTVDLLDKSMISFAVNPEDSSIVYAGSAANGLYRSGDAGENWEPYNGTGLTAQSVVYYIAIDRKNIKNMYLAGISDYGKGMVLKSEDEGLTWQESYVTLIAGDLVNKIEIDPYDTSVLYITTSKGQIYQSANYGQSWKVLNHLTAVVNNFVISSSDTRVLYASSATEGLFRSNNKGNDWYSLKGNLSKVKDYDSTMNAIAVDPVNSNIVYVGFLNGMLKSVDGGASWAKVNIITPATILPMSSLIVSRIDSKSIYYTIDSQVYFTNNGAESNWSVRNLPTTRATTALTIDPNNPKIIYIGTLAPVSK